MLGIYNYTVILTYMGLLSGFAGILCAFEGNLTASVLCLMGAGLCDMFDGKVASTKKERSRSEKRFGIQIDSLSDLVCFGVLPAIIVYSLGGTWFRTVACAVYVLCALIRLAWFNVDEEARQDFDTGRRKVYLGLPVTSAALIFPLLYFVGGLRRWPLHIMGPLTLLIVAGAFLTPFSIRKPSLNVKRKPRLRGSRRLRRKERKKNDANA